MVCIQKCQILGPFHSLGNHPQAYLLGGCLASITLSGGPLLLICRSSLPFGFSRQKQILRFSGAVVGGLPFGMGAQILQAETPQPDAMDGWWFIFLTEAGGEIVTVIVMELCWMYGRSANLGAPGIVAKVRG
jgi:hypothetical protein